jgi:tetratricopeptide (TPR) repeat protein
MNKCNVAMVLLYTALMQGCVTEQTKQVDASKDTSVKPEPALNANTRFAAGQVAETQGDPGRAIQQYEEAVKLDPKASEPLLRIGIIYTTHQKYDQAIEAWNRYIKVTNGAPAGYSNLGYCLELDQRPHDAEAAYKAGIAKDPRNETCRVNYGLMLARQGRLAEATAQLQAVLNPANVHYDLASVLAEQGNKSAARAEFQKALDADPDMNDAKARLAALETK